MQSVAIREHIKPYLPERENNEWSAQRTELGRVEACQLSEVTTVSKSENELVVIGV